MPHDNANPNLQIALKATSSAGGLLITVPAYWSCVSASFKNLIEVLCGPAFDLDDPSRTLFAGKFVGLVIVGADNSSTEMATLQAERILRAVGARIVEPSVQLTDPRRQPAQVEVALADSLGLAMNIITTIGSAP
jgi:NAD(P)H-dependent FMN reductase